jgi:hypothetical protein
MSFLSCRNRMFISAKATALSSTVVYDSWYFMSTMLFKTEVNCIENTTFCCRHYSILITVPLNIHIDKN